MQKKSLKKALSYIRWYKTQVASVLVCEVSFHTREMEDFS
jgi:hypothetical protein